MRFPSRVNWMFLGVTGLILMSSCTFSSRQKLDTKEDMGTTDSNPALSSTPSSIQTKPPSSQEMQQRIDTLEQQLSAMNETMQSLRITVDNLMAVKQPPSVPVKGHPAEKMGVALHDPNANQPDQSNSGFEAAIQKYKSGIILYESGKYPESALEFHSFVEDFADHPLAGSAQFYVGDSYYRQGEIKLALEEFKRVLISYDRSPHISDSLKRLVEIETKLNLAREAAQHQQLLTSLFRMSPATDLPDVRLGKPVVKTPKKTSPDTTPGNTPDIPPTAPVEEHPQDH